MVSAVSTARALGGLGECPIARTVGGRSYDEPWEGANTSPRKAPSFAALSDWYDKAEEEIGRYAVHPRRDAAELATLKERWENLPNRAWAMVDAMGAGILARELAQRALCLWHDAESGDTAAKGLRPLPAPLPAEKNPITDFVEDFSPWKLVPWWVYLAAGFAVYNWASKRLPDVRR